MRRPLLVLAAITLAVTGLTTFAHAGDSAALRLLPPGTSGIVQVDLAGIRTSSLYKELYGLLSANPEFQKGKKEAQEKMGFDIDRDLTDITVAIDGNGDGMVLLAGTFDQKKIAATAKKEGAANEQKHKGVPYWRSKDGTAVAFLGKLVVIGKEAAVKLAIGASKGARLEKTAAVMKLAKGVNQKKHVWGAAALPKALREKGMKELSAMHGHVDLSKGIAVLAVAAFDNAKTAAKIVGDFQQQMKQAQSNPGFAAMGIAPLMNKIKAKAKGKSVEFKADWNQQDVAKLKALAAMFGGMMAGAQQQQMPPPKATPPPKK